MTSITDIFGKTSAPAQTAVAPLVPTQQREKINPKTGRPYEKSRIWLNPGVMFGDRFVAIPNAGIGLDTLEPAEAKDNDTAEWVEDLALRNLLLKALQAKYNATTVKAGETVMVEIPIVFQVRHKASAKAGNVVETSDLVSAFAEALGLKAA